LSSRLAFRWLAPVLAGALVGVALRLVFSGNSSDPFNAMMGAFTLLVPVLVAAVAVHTAELTQRRSWSYYFGAGASANVLFIIGTLLALIEGVICAIVAVPLFGLIGGLAGLATGALCRLTMRPRRVLYCAAILPLAIGSFEQHIPLPDRLDMITRSRVVAATPEAIWTQLLDVPNIAPSEIGGAWMYRIGAPLPLSALTERRGDELVRHVAMERGVRFDQVATDWETARRVTWTYRFEPDSFPAGSFDDHVKIGGRYFDVLDTRYLLERVESGTRITATMRYRVSTHFNWYARPLARFFVANFERAALELYATRAEARESGAQRAAACGQGAPCDGPGIAARPL
jgi:hypothetical protein